MLPLKKERKELKDAMDQRDDALEGLCELARKVLGDVDKLNPPEAKAVMPRVPFPVALMMMLGLRTMKPH